MNKFIIIILLLFSFQAFSQKKPISKNAREIVNSDGTITRDIFSSDVFYKSGNEYLDIDNRFLDYGDYWIMNQNNHTIRVRKNLKADSVFWFDYEDKDIILEPVMALYNNKNGGKGLIDTSWHFVVKDVTGYKKDDYTIRFENAFKQGIHLEVTTASGGFKINKIIDSNVLIFPNGAQWFDFIFRLKGSNNVDYDGWDKQSLDSSKEVIRLTNVGKYIIDKPKMNKEDKDIKIVLSKQNTQLYITKRIRGLSDGEGIITDINIITDAADGCLYTLANFSSWATTRNATNSIGSDNGASMLSVFSGQNTSNKFSISRSIVFFNIGLPSNSIITSAGLSLSTSLSGVSADTIFFFKSTATSVATNNASYSSFDSTYYLGTHYNNSVTYNELIGLNENGKNYIQTNVTSTNCAIMFRARYDYRNIIPTANNINYGINYYYSGYAVPTHAVTLVITYTEGAATSTSKSPHIINMKGF